MSFPLKVLCVVITVIALVSVVNAGTWVVYLSANDSSSVMIDEGEPGATAASVITADIEALNLVCTQKVHHRFVVPFVHECYFPDGVGEDALIRTVDTNLNGYDLERETSSPTQNEALSIRFKFVYND